MSENRLEKGIKSLFVVELYCDSQRLESRPIFLRQADEILFCGDQSGIMILCELVQISQIGGPVSVVVWKRYRVTKIQTEAAEGLKEFLWPTNTGETDIGTGLWLVGWDDTSFHYRTPGLSDSVRERTFAQFQDQIRSLKTGHGTLSEGAFRNDMAISKADLGINHDDCQIFKQSGVLVTIIHNYDIDAGILHRRSGLSSVSTDPAFAGLRQHQRFIPHIPCAVLGGLNLTGAFQAPLIAAGQRGGPKTGFGCYAAPQRVYNRAFSGPSHGQIAHTEHAGTKPQRCCALQAPRGHSSVYTGEGGE